MAGITIDKSKTPHLPSKEKSSTKPKKWKKTTKTFIFGHGITIAIFLGMFLIYWKTSTELDAMRNWIKELNWVNDWANDIKGYRTEIIELQVKICLTSPTIRHIQHGIQMF